MKKRAISLIIVLFILNTIRAQNFDWAKSFGSPGYDMGDAIAVDAVGNVITVGHFSTTVDFDPSPTGIHNLTAASGGVGMFISKLSPTGAFIWAKSFDGGSYTFNHIRSVATDASGNIYTVGEFGAAMDFDPSPSTSFTLAPNGPSSIFVSKLDASGNFVWAFQLGSPSNADYCGQVTVDASGNIYIVGFYDQTVDFDPTAGVSNLSVTGGGTDVFIAKYTSAGNYIWAGRIGGGGAVGVSIAVDASQNIYATGRFSGTADMDPSPSATSTLAATSTSAAGYDMFVCKLDASCNFVWAKQFSGNGLESPLAITLDGSANVYLTGNFNGTVDFDPSAATHTLTANAGADAFICKLNTSGTFMWAHAFGSSTTDNDSGYDVKVSSPGNVFITGVFYGTTDFNPSPTATNVLSSAGSGDIFVSKFDSNGNFVWAKQMSGTNYDEGNSIAVDASENIYITGGSYGVVDYDPSPASSYTLASAGDRDIFICKLKPNGEPVGFLNNTGTNPAISLYPNPTTGKLMLNTIDYENTYVMVYNITGQKIMSLKLEGSSTIINLDHLIQGVYQLQFVQNNIPVYQSKVVKLN